jgi:hypothetical protein
MFLYVECLDGCWVCVQITAPLKTEVEIFFENTEKRDEETEL